MMRSRTLFVCLAILTLGTQSFARGGGNIMRGGLGFLFPDHNSFANPGQFAESRGMALQAQYARTNLPSVQMLAPSFVYGNGAMGLGVYGARAGATLGSGSDQIGAGLGFALLKGRMTFGLGFDKQLGAGAGDGDISAQLNFNSANRRGAAFGIGYRRTLGSTVQSLSAGLGYSFMSNKNIELDIAFPSISSFGNFDLGAYFTTMAKFFYLGGGYLMNKQGATTHGAAGRLGFILGSSFDVSGTIGKYFGAGNPTTWGATLRASF